MKKVVAGIDIGGTFTKLGIVDREGLMLADGTIQTDAFLDLNDYLDELSGAVKMLLAKSGENIEMQGIGIGAPNANYYKGTIENPPNLIWKEVVPMTRLIASRFDVPVAITNDANAAALGEMMYGDAGNMKNFIVLTLGTGLGGGFIVNGEVVYGHDGFAGEIGHINVHEDGRRCGCGRRGCLETYASATGIKRTVLELLSKRNDESELRKIPAEGLTAKNIFEAAKNGDKIGLKAFEMTGKILGKNMANLVALFSPEAIFLLGGLAGAGDFIFKPVKYHMEKNLLFNYKGKVKVLPSGLENTNPAVLGAAGLIWKELLG